MILAVSVGIIVGEIMKSRKVTPFQRMDKAVAIALGSSWEFLWGDAAISLFISTRFYIIVSSQIFKTPCQVLTMMPFPIIVKNVLMTSRV